MGGANSTYGGSEKCIEFLLESLKVRHHSEELDIDDSTVLKWIIGKSGARMGLY
jgi:hypothetical protein